MFIKGVSFFLVVLLYVYNNADAQSTKLQQGLLLKSGTNIRLGSVTVLNKRTLNKALSSTYGVFGIPAKQGDTLEFKSDNYQLTNFVVTDMQDKVIFMAPSIQLEEVVIKENSIKTEIKDTQNRYRKKSVFYTGTPHYYYLFLKPMTFIYENFKSEVKDARRFNRYARKELASYKVAERFNTTIKKVVPIKGVDLDRFKSSYMPTLNQINTWNDYDLIGYIKNSYTDFLKNGTKYDEIPFKHN
jgi:hypothetical protein